MKIPDGIDISEDAVQAINTSLDGLQSMKRRDGRLLFKLTTSDDGIVTKCELDLNHAQLMYVTGMLLNQVMSKYADVFEMSKEESASLFHELSMMALMQYEVAVAEGLEVAVPFGGSDE